MKNVAMSSYPDLDLDQDESTLPPGTISRYSTPCLIKQDVDVSSPVPHKNRQEKIKVASDTFVSLHAQSGRFQARFQLLPYTRNYHAKYLGPNDHLAQFILKGGGLLEGVDGEMNTQNANIIKILDLEYIRENLSATQDMLLPYDCFSSVFIWNQIYQRSSYGPFEKRNADLNLFRISPSAHVSHDANLIFQGSISWNDIQPIASDKLAPAIKVRDAALMFFPELVVLCKSIKYPITRRVYTRHESQMLLDAICEMNFHGRVKGISPYNEIASRVLTNRTGQSLKEHFRKTILPHVLANDGYYNISEEDLAKFKGVFDPQKTREGMETRTKRKRCHEQEQEKVQSEDDNEEGYFTP